MEQNNSTATTVIKQRVHRSEEEIQKHLVEQEESGFSVKDYCEMYDINEQTFNSWIKKYKNKSDEEVKARLSDGQGFTTIEIIPSAVKEVKPELFAEIGKIKLYKEVSAEYLKSLLS